MPRFNRQISVELLSTFGSMLFTDLRMTVTSERSDSSDANTSEIIIYNLAQNTVEKLVDSNWSAIVKSGYKDEGLLSVICSGDVSEVSAVQSGANTLTTLKLADGGKILESFRKGFSFAKGSSALAAIKTIAAAAGLPLESSAQLAGLQDTPFSAGFTTAGSLWVSLDRICDRIGAAWSIQNGELRLSSPVKPVPGGFVLLSASTGLIGSPEKIKLNVKVPKAKDKQVAGWIVRTLLQPTILPGDGIVVTSKELKSVPLIVKSIKHSADNWQGDFMSTIEGVIYG